MKKKESYEKKLYVRKFTLSNLYMFEEKPNLQFQYSLKRRYIVSLEKLNGMRG